MLYWLFFACTQHIMKKSIFFKGQLKITFLLEFYIHNLFLLYNY